jgi:hypothetical protein
MTVLLFFVLIGVVSWIASLPTGPTRRRQI